MLLSCQLMIPMTMMMVHLDYDGDDSDIKDSGGNDDVAVRGHLERCKKRLAGGKLILVPANWALPCVGRDDEVVRHKL